MKKIKIFLIILFIIYSKPLLSQNSWTNIFDISAYGKTEYVTVNNSGELLVKVARDERFVYTSDQGQTWSVRTPNPPVWLSNNIYSYGDYLVSPKLLDGIIYSTDFGTTWGNLPNLETAKVYAMMLKDSSNLFLRAKDMGLLRYSFEDSTITSIANGLDSTNVIYIAKCSKTDILCQTSSYKIYTSSDNGNSWIRRTNPSNTEIRTVSLYNNFKLTVVFKNQIFTTTNSCVTWTQINVPQPYIYNILETDERIYCATLNRLYSSSDQGATWDWQFSSDAVNNLIETGDGTVYAAVSEGLLKTTDNGNNWEIESVPSFFSAPIHSIKDFGDRGIFIGTGERGLFNSLDNGSNWDYLGFEGYKKKCNPY